MHLPYVYCPIHGHNNDSSNECCKKAEAKRLKELEWTQSLRPKYKSMMCRNGCGQCDTCCN